MPVAEEPSLSELLKQSQEETMAKMYETYVKPIQGDLEGIKKDVSSIQSTNAEMIAGLHRLEQKMSSGGDSGGGGGRRNRGPPECYHCGEKGHIKPNCKTFLAEMAAERAAREQNASGGGN